MTETRPARLPRCHGEHGPEALHHRGTLPRTANSSRADSAVHSTRPGAARNAGAVVERVAVLAPMVSELKPVIRAFGLEPAPTAADPKRYAGRVGAIDVVASMTGIGMVPAADATERVLAAEHPDFVMVVGIAGGVGDDEGRRRVRAERRRQRSDG